MDVLTFIKDYYFLIGLIIGIINIVICIIFLISGRKKDNVLAFIDKVIPDFINQAEESIGAGNGSAKLKYVVGLVHTALNTVFKIKDSNIYNKYIKNAVETILSTPQKKEVVIDGNEKKS